ncbi:MAG: alkaline phosphatase [Vicinamibacterales bacterium]
MTLKSLLPHFSCRTARIPRGPVALVVVALLAAAPRPTGAQQERVETPQTWFDDGRAALAEALALPRREGRARNVVLVVGDGMGLSTVAAARILEGQQRGQRGEENRLAFEDLPYVALSKTYSVNQQVADSAPTMTALITGVKTNDGILSLDQRAIRQDHTSARGRELRTLLEMAEDAGKATGIVSTARITHATPAATYAHAVERDWEDDSQLSDAARTAGYPDIARQLIDFSHGNGIEVALGGGRQHFLPETMTDPEYGNAKGQRKDGRNLAAEWAAQRPGGQWIWNRAQFDAVDPATTTHLLGLFEPSHMQYEHDRPGDAAGEPSLSEMASKALDVLSRDAQGFFLLIEGGRIDHAHHAGNAYRALTETIELSNTVRAVLSRVNLDDTLVIVTADHSHVLTFAGYPRRGNPILGKVIGNEDDGSPSTAFDVDLLGRPYTTLSYANGPGFPGATDQQGAGPKHFVHAPRAVNPYTDGRPRLSFVDTTAPDYLQESMVPLAGETHGGEDVAIYATGPWAHLFHGVHEQHYVFHVMSHALGLSR